MDPDWEFAVTACHSRTSKRWRRQKPTCRSAGVLLRRVPARARTHLQGALVAGGIVTVIALPLIYREGSQPDAKAILDQDFRLNLTVLVGGIATAAVTSYLWRCVRARRAPGPPPPAGDQPPKP